MGLTIYNSSNVGFTVPEMQKLHKLPEEKKKISGWKTSFFYDLKLVEDHVPADILDTLTEQIIEQHCTMNLFCVAKAISEINGLQYYIYADLGDYQVYNRVQGKVIYRIAQCIGMRCVAYEPNCYGVYNSGNMPVFSAEYGTIRQSHISHVREIQV